MGGGEDGSNVLFVHLCDVLLGVAKVSVGSLALVLILSVCLLNVIPLFEVASTEVSI